MPTVVFSKTRFDLYFKEYHPPLWISFWVNDHFMRSFQKLTGTDVGALTFVDRDEITGYMQSDALDIVARSLEQQIHTDWVSQQLLRFNRRVAQLYRLIRKAKSIPPSTRASKKLLAEVFRLACTIYPFSNAMYLLNKNLERSVQRQLSMYCSTKHVNEIMALAGTPIKPTTLQKFQCDLVIIAKKLKHDYGIATVIQLRREYSRNYTVQKTIDILQRQYRYLTALNAGERTAESFFSEIIAARYVAVSARHIKIPPSIRDEIRILRTGAYFKDEISSAIIPRVKYELCNHWNTLAQHLRLSFKELEQLTAEQVVLRSITPGQAKRLVVQQRRRIMFAHLPFKKTVVLSGKSAMTQDRLLRQQEKPIDRSITSFPGQIGSPGRARGIVHVLAHSSHIRHFIKGRILVTIYTAPEYVPAMKQAKAIITDTGGITSHAAIVSRELHKPCIVNAQVATRLLHTGDLVEVDAHKGIVTVLTRKKK